MPKGPKGEKRPADVNACAVMVAKIATGEVEEDAYRTPLRRRSGAAGGAARAAKMAPEERRAVAKKAANARWGR